MSLDVLFTHSYYLAFDDKQRRVRRPYPPLGTLYAMAAARERGHRVSLHDVMFEPGPETLQAALERHEPRVLVVYDDGFNYLTKMCLSNMQAAALEMIRLAKARGAAVVVSSSDAADHRERYLEAGADAVIVGEGEITLVETLAAIDRGEALDDVAGLALRRDGELCHTAPRANSRDLDELPRPAWDLIDLEPYEQTWRQAHGFFSLNAVSTRGCPYQCTWCAKPIYGAQYAFHSPARFVDDLAHLVETYGVDHFWFADDIFGLRADWVEELARLVDERGLDIRFTIQSRADLMARDALREGLLRAGLDTVWLGAESGSQKVLDAMKKGIRVEDVYRVVPLLQAAGVRVGLFLQFGYLGETRDDIERTIEMVLELLPDEIGISVSYPLPGTEFHHEVARQLGAKTNWAESDDLAILYRGTYPPAFYRRLYHYVHKLFRRERGLRQLGRLARRPWTASPRALKWAAATFVYAPWAALDGLWLKRLERAS